MIIFPDMQKGVITKVALCFSMGILLAGQLFSQGSTSIGNMPSGKPSIDTSTINNWYGVDEDYHVAISNDGKWFTYRVKNLPRNANTLYVESTDKKWSRSFINAEKVLFSDDNRQFVFKRNDSLFILKLGVDNDPEVISRIKTYKAVSSSKHHWLAYQLQGSNELILLNLIDGRSRRYLNADNFLFNDQGTVLLLQQNTLNISTYTWVALQTNSVTTIYKGNKVVSGQFDKAGKKLVFSIANKDNSYSIWQYNEGEKAAVERVNSSLTKSETQMDLGYSAEFSYDGKYIYLQLVKKLPKPDTKSNITSVNIWSYRDSIIQSAQTTTLIQDIVYPAVISVDMTKVPKIVQLVAGEESIYAKPYYGDYVVVTWNNNDQIGDRVWLKREYKAWLVSLRDGNRRDLNQYANDYFFFSPEGKYLLIWDKIKGVYMSYNLKPHEKLNICKGIPDGHFAISYEFFKESELKGSEGVASFVSDEESVLVYDKNDLWKLDLTGKNYPLNITRYGGTRSSVKLRAINCRYDKGLSLNQMIVLSAFDTQTMKNGFAILSPNWRTFVAPKLEDCIYFHERVITEGHHYFYPNMEPIKAKKADVWIVKRQSFNQSPNYFLTLDFKVFNPLTKLAPQESINWLKAGIIRFNQTDGSKSQGVLYIPENFDSTKKYPVVINYYQQFTHRLFGFPRVNFTNSADINIPWFVSNGYLVFTPDIYFTKIPKAACGLRAVVGAAMHLSTLSFVDKNKLGIAGHSMAGGLTNYIITQTNLFAAAMCGGVSSSDLISRALQLVEEGSQLGSIEEGMGGPIWNKSDFWVSSSPIMHVEKVATPYLIFHCRADGVPFQQSVEMFLALRRLSKRAWLLEY